MGFLKKYGTVVKAPARFWLAAGIMLALILLLFIPAIFLIKFLLNF